MGKVIPFKRPEPQKDDQLAQDESLINTVDKLLSHIAADATKIRIDSVETLIHTQAEGEDEPQS